MLRHIVPPLLLASNAAAFTAPEYHERLVAKGDAGQWPFYGAGGLAHHRNDPPPPRFSDPHDDACGTVCTFSPIKVNRSGDSITIKYNMPIGVSAHTDWVGLYEVGAPNKNYFEYFVASVDWQGEGQRTFELYNFRTKLDTRFMNKDNKCLCKSEPIEFALGAEEPTQGHISLTEKPSEMQVTWLSGATGTGFVELEGVGKFETTASTYKATDMCNSPATSVGPWAWRDPGMIHTATLTGLKGDTEYSYRFGHGDVASEWAAFRTEPDGSKEWLAVAYGDMGASGTNDETISDHDDMPGARLVQLDLMTRKPSLIAHFGDLSYARSCGFVWDIWLNQISPIARTTPYMVSLGNHEYDHSANSANDPFGAGFHPSWGNYGDDSSGECGVPVIKRFPNPPATGNGIIWYSYNYANTHWVMLSSEHDYTPTSAEYKWFEKDLASVDRTKTPWVIVTAHRPAYNSEDYQGDYNVAINMAENLDSLLVKYKVNLFLAGHYHAYQRTCQVANMACQPGNAPHHITVGSAGASLDYTSVKPEGRAWTLHTHETFGTLSLKVRPDKIIGEFWGAENYASPKLPFVMMDTFEVLPYNSSLDQATSPQIVV